jgi:hypothetical protein
MRVGLMLSENVQGACIVVAGNLLQFSAHRTLSRLSTADASAEDEEAYRLPRGKQHGMPLENVKAC